jgi:YL1 nuclear protein C-terminal domain
MSTTSAQQRKAWNEAMRTAAGTAAMPPALQTTHRKRRSDRRHNKNTTKQGRRDRARKVLNQEENSHDYRAAAWMDALEDVPATATTDGGDDDVGGGVNGDDDSYDELEELQEEMKGSRSGNRKKSKRKSNTKAGGAKKTTGTAAAGTMSIPKRFKARSLASILLEEVNREDGVAYAWLDNEARINNQQNKEKKIQSTAVDGIPSPPLPSLPLPIRKYCPVTGMEGIYIDPKSRIPYATLPALEQIRERLPPWMVLGGNIAYHEAVKSIRNEEEATN